MTNVTMNEFQSESLLMSALLMHSFLVFAPMDDILQISLCYNEAD